MSAVTITAIMPLPARRQELLPRQGHQRELLHRHVLQREPLHQRGHQQEPLHRQGHQRELLHRQGHQRGLLHRHVLQREPLHQPGHQQELLLQHTAEAPGEAEAMEGVPEAVPGQAAVTAVADTAAPQEAECQERRRRQKVMPGE